MTEEEREIFEERMAIIIIDGKMPPGYAKIKAWQQIEELRKKKGIKDVSEARFGQEGGCGENETSLCEHNSSGG